MEQTVFQSNEILSGHRQTDQKASVSLPQTSYGPEGRGFESLRAYQNHGNSLNFRGFSFDLCAFSGGWILRWTVDPSRDPYGNLERLGLESVGEKIPYRVCRLLLHRGGYMGVGVQRKPGGVVAQHGGEGFDIYSVLQGQHRKCVSEVMEAYPLQSRPFQNPLEHVQNAVRGHLTSVWRGENIFVLLLHSPEHVDCFCSYRNTAVGVFGC